MNNSQVLCVVLPNGNAILIPVNVTKYIVLGVVSIIIRLTVLFVLTRIQRGNAVRENAILRFAHEFGLGLLLYTLFIHLIPKVNPISIYDLIFFGAQFFMFCKAEVIVYICIEHLAKVFQLNNPIIEQEFRMINNPVRTVPSTQANSTSTESHQRATARDSDDLNNHHRLPLGDELDMNSKIWVATKDLMVVSGLSLIEFCGVYAVRLSTSSSQAWYTFEAVTIHKFVISFIIFTEPSAKKYESWFAIMYILVQSLALSLSIGGAAFFTIDIATNGSMIAVFQALAIATLTYLASGCLDGQQN